MPVTACTSLVLMAWPTAVCPSPLPEIVAAAPVEIADAKPAIDPAARIERWHAAAWQALTGPDAVALPHAETGTIGSGFSAARGFAFSATEGQTLRLRVERPVALPATDRTWTTIAARPAAARPLFVDLFRIDSAGGIVDFHRIDTPGPDTAADSALEVPMQASGDYVLRLQSEPGAMLAYAMTIELEAALIFPLPGASTSAVRGHFGDSRANGTRRHEGIDVFAARGTPVVAVTDGYAMPGRDELGGNVVRLQTPNHAYYYAHLRETAMEQPRRVRAGEVLGTVGNSGNARRTPPHLHFSMYPMSGEAIDPMPHFIEHRFESPAMVPDPAIDRETEPVRATPLPVVAYGDGRVAGAPAPEAAVDSTVDLRSYVAYADVPVLVPRPLANAPVAAFPGLIR